MLVALYACPRLRRWSEPLDHLSNLLLELLHSLHVLVIEGGDEDQACNVVSEWVYFGGWLAANSPSRRTIWVVYIIFGVQGD